jgi:hypothetical protein
MKNEFVPYELALKLKELGFDEPCFVFWTNTPKYKGDNVHLCVTDGSHGHHPNSILFKQDFLKEGEFLAPTFSQAFRWFREKHNMPCKIEASQRDLNVNKYHYFCQILTSSHIVGFGINHNLTFEETELACLEKLIEIVESKSE